MSSQNVADAVDPCKLTLINMVSRTGPDKCLRPFFWSSFFVRFFGPDFLVLTVGRETRVEKTRTIDRPILERWSGQ